MSNDPLRVPFSKVVAFLQDLGLDPCEPKDISRVTIDPHGVEVVRFRHTETGSRVVVGETVATETTTFRMEYDA